MELNMYVSSDMKKMLDGYGLTTAHILYRMPDFPTMLQSFVWQTYDLAPNYPEVHKFLKFWEEKLDGPLHSVQLAHQKLIRPGEWQTTSTELVLH
jgi:uncharacterized protein Usg